MKICYLVTNNIHEILDYCKINNIPYQVFTNDVRKVYLALNRRAINDKQMYQIKKLERKFGKTSKN